MLWHCWAGVYRSDTTTRIQLFRCVNEVIAGPIFRLKRRQRTYNFFGVVRIDERLSSGDLGP